jgi:hypothetical protein
LRIEGKNTQEEIQSVPGKAGLEFQEAIWLSISCPNTLPFPFFSCWWGLYWYGRWHGELRAEKW